MTMQRLMQVPLAAVLPFLEGALRAAGERRRNASIIKSLRKAENLQCREAAIRCRQRYLRRARGRSLVTAQCLLSLLAYACCPCSCD